MSTITQHTIINPGTRYTIEAIHMQTGHSAQVTATSAEAALMTALKMVNQDAAPVNETFSRLAALTPDNAKWFNGIYARLI